MRDKVEFKNHLYNLRLIEFGEDWGVFFVGSIQLDRMLYHDDSGYTCPEAVAVDELIFYFVPPHYFKLSEDKLRDQILAEIG